MVKTGVSRAKPVTNCPHTDRRHLARGLCQKCYHQQGSGREPTHCEHKDRSAYAKGLCKRCYLKDYHRKVKDSKRTDAQNAVPLLPPMDRVL